MDLNLANLQPAPDEGQFLGRPILGAEAKITDGFAPVQLPNLMPQLPIARPNPGMMGGVGQYLQPMINQINQHYQQEQVQPFVQEVTNLANERFPDAFGGGLGGMRPIFDVARPMPAGDIFSGISGSALSLLQAR